MTDEIAQNESTNTDYVEPETVLIKLRVISSRDELQSMQADKAIKNIHLAFRPRSKDILLLVRKFPNVALLQLPVSYHKSLAKSMDDYLESVKVLLVDGDVWGHRRDLSEWATVKIEKSIIDAGIARLNAITD